MVSLASNVARAGLACLMAWPAGLAAQAGGWHLHGEVAASHVTEAARSAPLADEEITLRPYRPTTYGIRLERWGDGVGVGIALRYARPPLAFDGPQVGIIDRASAFTLYEVAPEVSMRVAGTAAGPSVRARVGPVVDVWSWALGGTRARLGARGAIGVDLPIGGRVAATIGAAATLTESMFSGEDVEPEFEPRAALRTEVGLGLRYRLR